MSFYGTLYPYQEAAAQLVLDEMRVLVAYEMGLGKTPITIAATEFLADDDQIDAGIIVCLSSLKYQWQKAIQRFTCSDCLGKLDAGEDGHEHTPTATSIVIDGTPTQRAQQYAAAETGAYRYILVNYEQVVNDWKQVRRLPRDFVVADEITALKSFRSQRSRRMKRLQAPYMVGLTGTPMENGKLEELYSIMQFLDDKVLGRFDLFDRTFIIRNNFGGVQRYRNVPLFRKTMERSWIVKTQKDEDVAAYLPQVSYQNHYVQMDKPAAKIYDYVANELVADLGDALSKGMSGFDLAAHYGGGNDDNDPLRGAIASKTMVLQMLCDHPALVKHSANRWRAGLKTGAPGGSEYAFQLDELGMLPDSLVKRKSPKMEATLALIDEALERPETKLVLFCHDVPMLPLLRDALPAGLAVVYDGTMSAKEKEIAKTHFQSDPRVRVFLSSDAGGFGLDLPQAGVLVHVDLPWSAGAMAQRSSRIIRASSKYERVSIHTMLVDRSVDLWVYNKVAGKVAAADAFVLGRGLDTKGGIDMTAEGLMAFLQANQP